MSTKRSIALLGASSMLLSILPAAAFAQQTNAVSVHALEKTSNAQQISALWAKGVDKADTVLITTEGAYADSLASGVLQGTDKPLFFVGKSLDDTTKAAIKRLGATKATILGGEKAVTPALVKELEAAGLTTNRIEGAARVETSIAIAKAVGAKDDTVLVATQDNYADAIGAGALAAKTGHPVIVVPGKVYKDGEDKDVNLHPAVAAYLKEAGIKKVMVVGGSAAVSDTVFGAIKDIVADTTRLAGGSRVETAAALAAEWGTTSRGTIVDGFANTNNGFYNGFAAALTAAKSDAPIILSNQAKVNTEKVTADSGVAAYCGTLVDQTICTNLATRLGGTVTNVTLSEAEKPVDSKISITPNEPVSVSGRNQLVVTAKGLDAAKKYNLILAATAEKDGVMGVKMDGTAVSEAGAGNISVINDVRQPQGLRSVVGVKPEGDTLRFTVASDSDVLNNTVIGVIMDETGAIVAKTDVIYLLPKSAGSTFSGVVESVNPATKTIVLNNVDKVEGARRTISYGVKDVSFATTNDELKTKDGIKTYDFDPARRVTADIFARDVSPGDVLLSNAYYADGSFPTNISINNLRPGRINKASKVKMTPKANSVIFTISDPEKIEDLTGGSVNVRFGTVGGPIGDITDTNFATFNPENNVITYGYPDGTAGHPRAAVQNVRSATITNLAKDDDGNITFSVDGLNPFTEYAFIFQPIRSTGDTGKWSADPVQSKGNEVRDNYIFNTKTLKVGADLKLNPKLRIYGDHVANDGRGNARGMIFSTDNPAFRGAVVDGSKIEITAGASKFNNDKVYGQQFMTLAPATVSSAGDAAGVSVNGKVAEETAAAKLQFGYDLPTIAGAAPTLDAVQKHAVVAAKVQQLEKITANKVNGLKEDVPEDELIDPGTNPAKKDGSGIPAIVPGDTSKEVSGEVVNPLLVEATDYNSIHKLYNESIDTNSKPKAGLRVINTLFVPAEALTEKVSKDLLSNGTDNGTDSDTETFTTPTFNQLLADPLVGKVGSDAVWNLDNLKKALPGIDPDLFGKNDKDGVRNHINDKPLIASNARIVIYRNFNGVLKDFGWDGIADGTTKEQTDGTRDNESFVAGTPVYQRVALEDGEFITRFANGLKLGDLRTPNSYEVTVPYETVTTTDDVHPNNEAKATLEYR